MVWSNFLSRLAITSRYRGLTTATIYGLSLAVRFTSAAGEGVEVPAQYVQRATSVTSVMTKASPRSPYEDWANSPRPILFRCGWSLGSPGCRAGM